MTFVEQCRREWKRLGVEDPVADEMAAELRADLEEAEAEGVSAEEVLGGDAYDARVFAAAWAAERGVARRPSSSGRGRTVGLAAAVAAFALTGIAGAVLTILGDSSTGTRLAVESLREQPGNSLLAVRVDGPRIVYGPDGQSGAVVTYDLPPVRQAPAPVPFPMLGAQLVTAETDDAAFDTRTVGLVLLTVGLAGALPLALFWLLVGTGRAPKRAY